MRKEQPKGPGKGPGRGGSRPGNPNGTRGGRRVGHRPGPPQRHITISKEAAKTAKVMVMAGGHRYDDAALTAYIERLIVADWSDYDAYIIAVAEKAL